MKPTNAVNRPSSASAIASASSAVLPAASLYDAGVSAIRQQQQQPADSEEAPSAVANQPSAGATSMRCRRQTRQGIDTAGLGLGTAQQCCAGCSHPIRDQYVLHVDPDLDWHADCLRCTECRRQLDETCTCFVRDGRPYCKADYARLFAIKCSRCGLGFDRNQFVMRAPRDRVYHVDCFRCVVCQSQLVPGSEFALRPVDSGLVCRADYDALLPAPAAAGLVDMSAAVDASCMMTSQLEMDDDASSPPDAVAMAALAATTSALFYANNNNIENEIDAKTRNGYPDGSASSGGGKKHVSASSGGTRHVSGSRGSSGKSHGHHEGQGQGHGHGHGHHSSGTTKTTRIRTVLNEKQLHTLRTCYAANPRPDALMKDQLVEMTGLSSRVIRVWFQNKRCKDKKRTILIKQLQLQHQDKVHGVPMIASSPVRMQDHQSTGPGLMQASAVQIHHQYIVHQQQSPPQQPLAMSWGPPPQRGSLSDYPPSGGNSSSSSSAAAAVHVPAGVCLSSTSSSSISPTSSVPPAGGVSDLDSEPTCTAAAFQQLLDTFGGGGGGLRPSSTGTMMNILHQVNADDVDSTVLDDDDEDVGTVSMFPDDDDTVVSIDEPSCGGRDRRTGVRQQQRSHRHGQANIGDGTVLRQQQQQQALRTRHALMNRMPSSGTMVDATAAAAGAAGGGLMTTNHRLMCTDARC